jgi:hypothetical protein
MPILEVGQFNSYTFSEEELPLATTFSELQLAHIQSEIAKWAIQKNNLAPAPGISDDFFIRSHEYHRGAMDALIFLVSTHEQMNELLADMARRHQAQQEMNREG